MTSADYGYVPDLPGWSWWVLAGAVLLLVAGFASLGAAASDDWVRKHGHVIRVRLTLVALGVACFASMLAVTVGATPAVSADQHDQLIAWASDTYGITIDRAGARALLADEPVTVETAAGERVTVVARRDAHDAIFLYTAELDRADGSNL